MHDTAAAIAAQLLYVRARPLRGPWHRVWGDPADMFGLSPVLCGAEAPIELASGQHMWGQIAVSADPVADWETPIYCAACVRARLRPVLGAAC